MAKVSKDGQGKTLYIEVSVYPCGGADPTKNLTISCPAGDTRFKTTLSDAGLAKFKEHILALYSQHVLNRVLPQNLWVDFRTWRPEQLPDY